MSNRVLLDLTPLEATSARRGIGRYVRGLLRGMAELSPERLRGLELVGFTADAEFQGLRVVEDVQAYVSEVARVPVAAADARRNLVITWDLPAFTRTIGGRAHLTDPKGIPWSREFGLTLTAHDLIPLLLPELYLPRVPGYVRFYRGWERWRYARAHGLIAVSGATQRDLSEHLGIPSGRIRIIHHGVEHERFRPEPQPGETQRLHRILGSALGSTSNEASGGQGGRGGEPFVLYLGAGDGRKDLDTLITAFGRSRLRNQARLVIAGHLGPKRRAALRRCSIEQQLDGRVLLPGFFPEALVPALYRACAIHVFPSRYEGFGLPVLEAMAAGAPTITSPGSSLEEVAGDAAVIVPCGDAEALSARLEELFFDSERRLALRARGLAWAAQFTWQRCAAQTLDFFRDFS